MLFVANKDCVVEETIQRKWYKKNRLFEFTWLISIVQKELGDALQINRVTYCLIFRIIILDKRNGI